MKISQIVTEVNCKYGAPMGRPNIGKPPITITSGNDCRIVKSNQIKTYIKRVNLIDGYDIGGAYWGMPNNLYVMFTKDLSYLEYIRK